MEIKEIKTTGLKREFEITITNKSIDQLVQNKIFRKIDFDLCI